MKNFIIIFIAAFLMAGCASTGGSPTTQPTSQPSQSQIQQSELSAITIAQTTVIGIDDYMQLAVAFGAISESAYNSQYQPDINAALAALSSLQTQASTGALTLDSVNNAIIAALQTVLADKQGVQPAIQSAKLKAAK